MTKETKIGLLVGLAFIVLFAIILSEKGATPGTKAPSALTIADASDDIEAPVTGQGPLHDAGRLPVDPQLAPIVSTPPVTIEAPPMAEEPVGQLVPHDDSQIVPLPAQLVERLNLPVQPEPLPPADEIQDEPVLLDAPVSLADAVAAAAQGDPDQPTRDTQAASAKPDETLVSQTETPDPVISPRDEPRKTAPSTLKKKPQARKILAQAVHKVRKGETLGRIAAKYYGRCTPTRLRAIQDANPGVLESVHDIRPDMKLTIPVLAESGDLFEPATDTPIELLVNADPRSSRDDAIRIPLPVDSASRANRQATRVSEPQARRRGASRTSAVSDFRWYEIRKSDSLAKIAKRELGDEGRFLEIYRLNRDRIPNKDQIRPGLKIRLPAQSNEIASSQGPRTPGM